MVGTELRQRKLLLAVTRKHNIQTQTQNINNEKWHHVPKTVIFTPVFSRFVTQYIGITSRDVSLERHTVETDA